MRVDELDAILRIYAKCRPCAAWTPVVYGPEAPQSAALGGGGAGFGCQPVPSFAQPRPQPRRLILTVDSPDVLGRRLVKTKEATISIPELADEASPLPWGWQIAGQDRFRDLRCSVSDLLVDAAVGLETGVPPWMRDNPQIKAQIRAIRNLQENPSFTVVIHEHVRWPTAGGGVAPGHLDDSDDDDDEGSAVSCCFEDGPGRVQEVFGDPGVSPSGLPSLDLDGLAAFILSGACRSVVLLTGAGISTASGIPDYRGSGGLWRTLAPERLTATAEQRSRIIKDPEWAASIELFRENPLPLLEIKRDFVLGLASSRWRPTVAHFFARLLHDHGLLTRVLTQNIDGLHQDAGVPDEKVTEIHGTTRAAVCCACGSEMSLCEFAEALTHHIKNISAEGLGVPAPAESTPGGLPCPRCSGSGCMRPQTVLFGEPVNPAFQGVFKHELPKADLLIVTGTSIAVAPAGKAPAHVGERCVRLVINDRRVGENAGLCSDAPEAARDIMAQGNIDTVLIDLAGKLGWLSELSSFKGQMADASAALF